MIAQIQFHFWGTYTETLAIGTTDFKKVAAKLTAECPLSEDVGTPFGLVKSKGWQAIPEAKGVVANYSGKDIEKVHAYLKSLGCKDFASMKKSIDRGPQFDIPAFI